MKRENPSRLRFRLVCSSARSSAVEPGEKMRNARSTSQLRGRVGGGGKGRTETADWSISPPIITPPPPLVGQRMCDTGFRLRAAAAFTCGSEKTEITSGHSCVVSAVGTIEGHLDFEYETVHFV